MSENESDLRVGDRVKAKRAIGGGMFEIMKGEVTDIDEQCPLPHYDGTVIFVDGNPVREENVAHDTETDK